jgi:3,4-dihydroxy-2-butanone 4-phosphate synthase
MILDKFIDDLAGLRKKLAYIELIIEEGGILEINEAESFAKNLGISVQGA